MQEESRKNKNAKRLNFLKGRQSRNPSQTNGGAKIQINSETAIPKLQNFAQKYIGAKTKAGSTLLPAFFLLYIQVVLTSSC